MHTLHTNLFVLSLSVCYYIFMYKELDEEIHELNVKFEKANQLWLKSRSLLEKGKSDEAIKYAKEALNLVPEHIPSLLVIGSALAYNKQFNKALEVLFDALDSWEEIESVDLPNVLGKGHLLMKIAHVYALQINIPKTLEYAGRVLSIVNGPEMNEEIKLLKGNDNALLEAKKEIVEKTHEIIKSINPLDMFNEIFDTKNSLTFTASWVTKYYLELVKNYKSKFTCESSILAAAGILYAGHDVFTEKTISWKEIIDIANETVVFTENKKYDESSSLYNFIIELQIKQQSVYHPHIAIFQIRKLCTEEGPSTSKEVFKTLENYNKEEAFASTVKKFMTSMEDDYVKCRSDLGI